MQVVTFTIVRIISCSVTSSNSSGLPEIEQSNDYICSESE